MTTTAQSRRSPASVDDDTLLAAARAGDTRALDTLIGRWQGQVYRFGLRMCGDHEDARDVLQDTLLAAARSLRDFRGESAVSTWLFRIARSFCTKHRRRSVFAPKEELSLDELRGDEDEGHGLPAATGQDPEEATAAAEVRRALDRAIRSLDPKYREVLLLRDVEGLTAPEVAKVLELRVETVKTRLHRARLALRRDIGPLLTLPGALPPGFAAPASSPPSAAAFAPRPERPTPTSSLAAPAPPAAGEPLASPHSAPTPPRNEAPAAPPGGPCPDLPLLVSQYLEGDVERDLCTRLEQHVAHCQRCAEACAELRETVRLCHQLPADEATGATARPAAAVAAALGELRKALVPARSVPDAPR